jgi:hypothetical protein
VVILRTEIAIGALVLIMETMIAFSWTSLLLFRQTSEGNARGNRPLGACCGWLGQSCGGFYVWSQPYGRSQTAGRRCESSP